MPAPYLARHRAIPALMVELEERYEVAPNDHRALVHVTIGSGDDADTVTVNVDDCEPDDVVGPIVSRAVEEAFAESHLLCNFRIVGWHEPRPNTFSITETEEV